MASNYDVTIAIRKEYLVEAESLDDARTKIIKQLQEQLGTIEVLSTYTRTAEE